MTMFWRPKVILLAVSSGAFRVNGEAAASAVSDSDCDGRVPQQYGSCSGKFSWKVLNDCLEVTLDDDVKIPDPQTLDPSAAQVNNTFLLDGNWLRERCLDEEHVDMGSRQPVYDPHIYEDVTVKDVKQVDDSDELDIVFSDEVSCKYDPKMIAFELSQQRHGDVQAGLHVKFPDMFLWNSTLELPPTYDFEALVNDENSDASPFHGLTNILVTTGVAVVVNVPKEEGFCSKFGANISTNRDTEWGTMFNVRTSADNQDGVVKKDLAYTGKGIGLHTDNAYRDPMPDYQILHQIEGCDCGDQPLPCDSCGTENFFVDGIYVATKLREEDPEAFELLSTIEVRWENNGGDGHGYIATNKPIIELHSQGGAPCIWGNCIAGIRFSAKSGGYAPVLPPDVSKKFYAARRKFSAMLSDLSNRITLYLKPGQLVIFDNRRVLHARGTVVSGGVSRWLQGCYVNRDGLWYNWARMFHQRAQFTQLKDAEKVDFEKMGEEYREHVDGKILDNFRFLLERQVGRSLGQPVDLREHGVQTASRAYRGGENEDVVVMSLFHDMTETIVSKNHGEAAAGLLEPYINQQSIWMLRNHEVFQGYYYFHHFGGNRDERLQFKDHKWYQSLVDWCENYDQAGFDPGYPSLPFEFFIPMVERVLAREPFWWDPKHPKRAAVTGVQADSSQDVNAEL